jgi:hypothetical protein
MKLLVLSDSKAATCTVGILQFIVDNKEALLEFGINIKAIAFSIQQYNNPEVKAAFSKNKISSLPALITPHKIIYGKKIKDYITNTFNRVNREMSSPPPSKLEPESDDEGLDEKIDIDKLKRAMDERFKKRRHGPAAPTGNNDQAATATDILDALSDNGDAPPKRYPKKTKRGDDEDGKLLEKIGM